MQAMWLVHHIPLDSTIVIVFGDRQMPQNSSSSCYFLPLLQYSPQQLFKHNEEIILEKLTVK